MCTAITFQAANHYFGRNLDLEYHYRETVTIVPRNYIFSFKEGPTLNEHYAMIGMATVENNYPLLYDATNEHGLSVAALNFKDNASYHIIKGRRFTISPFEFIPWILCQCRSVQEAASLLLQTTLAPIPFSDKYSLTDLHWLISDKESSITVEPLKNGLHIIPNPLGVLTNNPPFDYHMTNLSNYQALTNQDPKNRLVPHQSLNIYSNGLGAFGIPGDLSSSSRFIRACFAKSFSVKPDTEEASVRQFFHILGAVSQQEGCVQVGNDFEKTVYSSCCNTEKGIYYFTTYENPQIYAVSMRKANLFGSSLMVYPIMRDIQISNLN